ncbi:uncharacterized protein N7477_008958 [Penicillium maclennaniae]|uniref:uncharacterized protein n=1 Tax=Penicillium maclennaniae TaxID=1343394 RepID=UPI002540FF70|nr:uncharacterized protein N7477_008958 [Penicillium maclennaniae]KAJ5666510.1 hypothetical protein N7477_008958 [Penicillium maclennaniae]
MRVAKGCRRCRHRHIRCVIAAGASVCTPCARLNRNSNGSSAPYAFVWDEQQVWVDVSQPILFVNEASHGWEGDDLVHESPASIPANTSETNPSPGRQLTTLSDITTGFNSSFQRASIHHELERTQTNTSMALSRREVSLMTHFIQKLAPWADICDPQSHFSSVVPRRAMENPMVFKAVMALAARHDAILTKTNDWEASSYLGQCLELLIAALDRPEHTYDDDLLVTVVILRIYEELENNTDEKFHLLGSNHLINLMSRAASSGGMAEAVSWQFLRQAIYASVVQYQHFQLDLRNYERSFMFQRNEDAAFANMIVFHCAHIIQLCRNFPRQAVEETAWHQISGAVDEWHGKTTIPWQPIRYQAPDLTANRPFPEVWMMSAPAVVGMQYYHTARVFLTLTDPRSFQMNDYARARFRHQAERTIAAHVATVIGLSLSNESVHNAYFMACHLLHRYGHCLRHAAEQEGSLDFLGRAEHVLGWRTAWIRDELGKQWAEMADV